MSHAAFGAEFLERQERERAQARTTKKASMKIRQTHTARIDYNALLIARAYRSSAFHPHSLAYITVELTEGATQRSEQRSRQLSSEMTGRR